ncbi:unnamed protein product [Cuscuta europaea]|uniref:Uncharacterized protein n=1 Tax=Cuscuta europaea TaxID=41803 RepID=A0A9P0Z113_CUSEU|nr:unnamed protein product [Cuscuta europaea]
MSVVWSREEEKAFENAIAIHWVEDSKEHWDTFASIVPSRTVEELKRHYQLLVEDVSDIEAGRVPLPTYYAQQESATSNTAAAKDPRARSATLTSSDRLSDATRGGGAAGTSHDSAGKGGSRSDQERRKGIPWSEEEHRLFLLGLDKFGKGDWRSISRNYVVSRTPTQVASHAQKYFIRLNSMNRDRRRTSIHDITSVRGGGDASPHQPPPITGQNPNATSHGMGLYGTPVGHPVAALPSHIASAVGTIVMLPSHAHPPYVLPVAYPIGPPPPPHNIHQK